MYGMGLVRGTHQPIRALLRYVTRMVPPVLLACHAFFPDTRQEIKLFAITSSPTALQRLHFAEFFVATCPASLLAAVFAIMQKRLRPIRPEWGQRPGLHCRDPVRAIRGRVARLIVDLDETEGQVATTGAPRWAPIVATCSSALLAASSLISSWSTRGHSARALIILRTEDHDVLEPLAGAPQVWSQYHCVRRRGNACRHTPSRLCQKFSRSFFCITGKKERDVETYCHK